MNLSKHFTLYELTQTQVRGIDNTPSLAEVENLKFLCEFVLEPVRYQFGPYFTSSGYRSEKLNNFIGGSPSSMHIPGCAHDGAPLRPIKWATVFEFLLRRKDIPLDQVIYEYGRWIHIGTRPEGVGCRRQALMIFEPGRYELWNPNDPRVVR